jgi:hypothetical protein
MKKILMLLMIPAFTSCDMTPSALLGQGGGGGNSDATLTSSNGCQGTTYTLQPMTNFPDGASCASPDGSIQAVSADSDGHLKIWLSQLSDGAFPEIAGLAYGLQGDYGPGGVGQVPFSCTVSSTHGSVQELDCAPQTSTRISPYAESDEDQELQLASLTLRNDTCGYSYTYAWSEQTYDCSSATTPVTDPITLDSTVLPDLWEPYSQ